MITASWFPCKPCKVCVTEKRNKNLLTTKKKALDRHKPENVFSSVKECTLLQCLHTDVLVFVVRVILTVHDYLLSGI